MNASHTDGHLVLIETRKNDAAVVLVECCTDNGGFTQMIEPIILFFILGISAGLIRAELRLPAQIYDFVSMLLLITIGLKEGIQLTKQSFITLLAQILVVFIMGVVLPLSAFSILRKIGEFKRADAA